MDVLKKDKHGQVSHILVNDHIPNPAFINEFQTNEFTLKLNSIELIEGQLEGYAAEEGGMFAVFHVSIRNNTNEILALYREDFMLSYDHEQVYPPEEYFRVTYQFEDEYALMPWEEKKGSFIFIVAKSAKKVTFCHYEYYDEEHFKVYRLRYRF